MEAAREKLIEALCRSDESTLAERVGRIEWLAMHDSRPSAYCGPIDTLRLLEEARLCFIGGHFVAAVLLATAFAEHTIADELAERGLIKGRPTLERMIELAREHLDLPEDLLGRTHRLRTLRNPFTHRRPETDQDTFRSRFLSGMAHPDAILEADAKLALQVMYELFGRTLKRAS